MKSKIWIDPQGGFNSDGWTRALIFSTETDELLAEANITFNYNRVKDTEDLTYEIYFIYESTKETESELYAELNEHGHALLQDEICEWYDTNNFSPDWPI